MAKRCPDCGSPMQAGVLQTENESGEDQWAIKVVYRCVFCYRIVTVKPEPGDMVEWARRFLKVMQHERVR